MNLSGFIAVGVGAMFGAWARWLLGLLLNPLFALLPLGTLAANLSGAYLIGLALGFFQLNAGLPTALKLFAITGFLGGLTTFSTFSGEVIERFLAQQPAWALALAASHLCGSLLLTWLGFLSSGAIARLG